MSAALTLQVLTEAVTSRWHDQALELGRQLGEERAERELAEGRLAKALEQLEAANAEIERLTDEVRADNLTISALERDLVSARAEAAKAAKVSTTLQIRQPDRASVDQPATKSCNSRKRDRTPEEAGMVLR